MPNAILKGSAKNPSIKLFNAIVFTLSLLILYWGFWKVEKPFWGLFLVALINATPFFLFEVYSRQNIFGLLASTFFIVLGVNLQVLLGKTKRLHLLILLSIISGVIIGFFSEIRNEVVIVGVSVLLLYLLSNQYNVVKRLLLALILLVSLLITRHLVRVYFELKFEETKQLVTAHGGHVYCGERIAGHKFWHPVFCGLGDFDTKYGYEWDDRIAYKFAVPILREKYGINVNYSGKYYTDDYYDDAKLYYIKFDEIPEYEQVVKEKVLGNITSDPVWYFTIIIKRIGRVLTRTIPFRYVGWLLFPLILFLIFKKRWDSLKIILISLPLSATSIIIFSGSGATFNSVFAYFVLAIVVYELLQFYTLGFNLKSAAFPFEDSLTSE
ncbi:MAG TPA: hypothetical protein PK563_15030 [Tenuifilaceae bacterium]|nr:hypothetical protein [Tenuifilaceae bacterium]